MATTNRKGARSAIDLAAKIAVLRYCNHNLTRSETAFLESNPGLVEAVGLAIESGSFWMSHEVVGLVDEDGQPYYLFCRPIGERRDWEREARKRTFPRNPALRRKLASVLERVGHIPERVLQSGLSRLLATELRDEAIKALRESGLELCNHIAGQPREEW
jgi:hypothetical protein